MVKEFIIFTNHDRTEPINRLAIDSETGHIFGTFIIILKSNIKQ